MTIDATFGDWLAQAWDAHAGDPAGTATRLENQGLGLAACDSDLQGLAALAHHLHGEHLGSLDAGRALLARLVAHPHAAQATRAACRRLDASLRLTAADADGPAGDPRAAMSASDGVRVTALAAGNLAMRDPARAGRLLREALAASATGALADDDPAVRAVAVTANNLACTLEELPARTPAQRELMIEAAQASRDAWARAGTWLETERADYRLAMTWLAAGDAERARLHAQACLGRVRDHGNVALEAFFAFEALARAEAARGDDAASARATEEAQQAFDRLDAGDRAWVQPSLDALALGGRP